MARRGLQRRRQQGLTLIGAIVGVALLAALGLFMMTLGLHFHRLERESRVGTQLNFVVDVLLARYRLLNQSEMITAQYHVTTQGLRPVDEVSSGEGLPSGWLDTVEVVIWTEALENGKRIWAVARSERSRRAVTSMKYYPVGN